MQASKVNAIRVLNPQNVAYCIKVWYAIGELASLSMTFKYYVRWTDIVPLFMVCLALVIVLEAARNNSLPITNAHTMWIHLSVDSS